MRLVVITSPATDAGKTFLAAGIAEAAAYRGLRTLFLELDVAVGDAIRVFGLAEAARRPHPTVATWNEYSDLAAACLKTPSGVCVLPRPELMPETVSAESVESLLFAVKNSFDIVIADLGADCYVGCWPVMVRSADVAILVSDCDEKALVRVKRFLTSCCPASPPGKWMLAVNVREKKGAYSPRDVMRFLGGMEEIGGTIKVPYFANVEKSNVKTFPPDSRFTEEVLKIVLENGGAFKKESGKGEKTRLGLGLFRKLLKRKNDGKGAQLAAEATPFKSEIFGNIEESDTPAEDGGGVFPFSPSPPGSAGAKKEAFSFSDRELSEDLSSVKKGVLLLLGPQSSSLADEMAAQGWSVIRDPSARADVAVVDADLLPSVVLNCPCVGFSNKISNWFQPDSGGALVVNNKSLIPSLIAPYARKDVGVLPSIPDQIQGLHQVEVNGSSKKGSGVVYAFYSGAQGSQGKTVIAVNAGALLANRGKRVCVVDLDTDKAGLTLLLGYSEMNLPGADVAGCVERRTVEAVKGPAGTNVLPAPVFTKKPGWFPAPEQVRWLISALADKYDYVLLDFGAKLASPPVLEALRMSDRIFVVSTPMRTALSAIARFRGRELMEIGNDKIIAIINRVGVRGGLSPRDAAALLGFSDYYEVPEDPIVAEAENDAVGNRAYHPPALRKKSLIGPALSNVLEAVERKAKTA